MIRCELIFEDWQKEGKSIYSTPLGIQLSMGDLHGGTIFTADVTFTLDAEHEVDLEREIVEAFAKHGACPVFKLQPLKSLTPD